MAPFGHIIVNRRMASAMAVSSPVAFISCRPLSKPPVPKGLASRRSELVGSGGTSLAAAVVAVPRIVVAPLVIQPVASGRRCELTGKKSNNAMKISYSHRRSKKLQFPNLQYKRIWWEAGKRFVKLRVCTQALKTIDRKGLEAMAKEAGINLRDY